MTLKVYNGLTKEKEEFKPLDDDGKTVKMYVCGQTVYDNMHIGHARTYVAFDIIKRYLEFLGYGVKTVINITDVNDKINDRATEEGRGPWEVAEEYARINLEDFEALGVSADAYPKASEYIEEMKELIQQLLDNGYAYERDGNVFFEVRKFDDYFQLSNQSFDDKLLADDDIIAKESKENPEDFVLWRAREDDNSPTWDSPWGEGVPGWHIECSAMSMRLLGDQFDIHGGGSDLVFPHHEDEIAQAEGATGKEWVKYWMHSGLVRMKDEKMSKSLGNFVSSRELLAEHDAEAIRLMIAGTHYRKPLDYSEQKIADAEKNLESLRNTVQTVQAELREAEMVPNRYTEQDVETLEKLFDHRTGFLSAMDDDFNTPEALKHLYQVEELLNHYVNDAEHAKRPIMERGLHVLQELGAVLGILQEVETTSSEKETVLESTISQILTLREDLREEGDYETADKIRDTISDSGIHVEDTSHGLRWNIKVGDEEKTD